MQKLREKRTASVFVWSLNTAKIASHVLSAKGHEFSKIGILIPLCFSPCEFNL